MRSNLVASIEIFLLSWKVEVHDRVYKSSSSGPALRQMNPGYSTYVRKALFRAFFRLCLCLPSVLFLVVCVLCFPVQISLLPLAVLMFSLYVSVILVSHVTCIVGHCIACYLIVVCFVSFVLCSIYSFYIV